MGHAIDAAVEMIERMKLYETALREIEWSNDTDWQADRARAALEYEPTWRAIEARVTGAQAQPNQSVPEGWLRAIDEALIVTHLGVANSEDTYEQAKAKLDSLIGFHVDEASDPAVNGGWKLVPVEPDVWLPIPEKHPTFDPVDLQFSDGSVLCGCVPQLDGDYWWEGPSGEVFIDPRYAPVTHWRLAAAQEAKP